MGAPPKAKPPSAPERGASTDRTSSVVAATLILLTALGVVTVFWEPLAALAVGAPVGETVGEARAPSPAADGGASTSTATLARDASSSS